MKKASIIALTIASAVVFIALAGVSLYRYFVDSRIQDGGRMENPDTYRAGKDLVEFEWRQNHRNFYSCFSLKFYREKDMPLLIGRFPDRSGDEMRESETDAYILRRMRGQTPCERIKTNHTIYCNRRIYHERT